MFLVTPANFYDSLAAIPLLALAVACFGFRIAIVRADAAYFTYALLNYIRVVLHAGFMIDYNLRKKGKTALATLPGRNVTSAWKPHAGVDWLLLISIRL